MAKNVVKATVGNADDKLPAPNPVAEDVGKKHRNKPMPITEFLSMVNTIRDVDKIAEKMNFPRSAVISKIKKFEKDYPGVKIWSDYERLPRGGGGRGKGFKMYDIEKLKQIAEESMEEGDRLREEAFKESRKAARRR